MESTTDFMNKLWEEYETGDITFDEYFDRLEQYKLKVDKITREYRLKENEDEEI